MLYYQLKTYLLTLVLIIPLYFEGIQIIKEISMMKQRKFIYNRKLMIVGLYGILIGLTLNGCNQENSIEKTNVDVLNRLYKEGINKQNLEVIEASLSEDYIRHCQAMPPELRILRGREEMMKLFKGHFNAFPDWNEEIEIKAVDNNVVAYLSKGIGTQTGPAGNLPPTGNKCDLDHIIIHRFEEGKIAETWVNWDNLTLLGQLGHQPPYTTSEQEIGSATSE
jgi:predicted ester cyclase